MSSCFMSDILQFKCNFLFEVQFIDTPIHNSNVYSFKGKVSIIFFLLF